MFAAVAGGLFADRGLDVELVDSTGATTERIAAGEAEFGLTAVLYFLKAQADADDELPARFAMVFHQRDPIAGLVREDSDIVDPKQLGGLTAARWGLAWMADSYAAGLASMEVEPPEIRAIDAEDPSAALRDGAVEVVPSWAETIPIRSYADVTVRAVPLGIEAYASGLVAGDRVDGDVVARMREALAAGYELQRDEPEVGVTAFHDRYPDIPREDAEDNWQYFVPFAFPDEVRPAGMDPVRWRATVEYISRAHDLPPVDVRQVYRT